jgi:cell fate (sporulation/competence/biofilm development) regulator YlbF (YheA/YmcA/DUF963 family)
MRAQTYVSDRLLHHARQRFGQKTVDSTLNLISQLFIHYFGSCNELQFLAGLSKHPNHFTVPTSSSIPNPNHQQADLIRRDVKSCLYDVLGRSIEQDLPFIPNSKHDAVLTELGFLQPEYDALLSQHHNIRTTHSKVKADYNALLSKFNELRRVHTKLKADYDTLGEGAQETQSDYATLQTAHKILQLKCNELESDCKALSKALRKNGNAASASDTYDTIAEQERVATLLKEIQATRTDWKNLRSDGRVVLENFNRAQAYSQSLLTELSNLITIASLFNTQLDQCYNDMRIRREDNTGWLPPDIPDPPIYHPIPPALVKNPNHVTFAPEAERFSDYLRNGKLAKLAGLRREVDGDVPPPSQQRFPFEVKLNLGIPHVLVQKSDGTFEPFYTPVRPSSPISLPSTPLRPIIHPVSSASSSPVRSQTSKHTANTQRPSSPIKLPSTKRAAESDTVRIVNKDGTVLNIDDMTAVDPRIPSPIVCVLLKADRLDLSAVIVAGLELRDANIEAFFHAITGHNVILAKKLLDAHAEWKTGLVASEASRATK